MMMGRVASESASKQANTRHRDLGLGSMIAASPHFLSAATARVTEEVLLDGLRVFEAHDVAHLFRIGRSFLLSIVRF